MTSTTIDGNATVVGENIFSVSSPNSLSLSTIKLTNGYGSSSHGGGIIADTNNGKLQLTVTDADGYTSTDSVNVHVN